MKIITLNSSQNTIHFRDTFNILKTHLLKNTERNSFAL